MGAKVFTTNGGFASLVLEATGCVTLSSPLAIEETPVAGSATAVDAMFDCVEAAPMAPCHLSKRLRF
jgi:hypothetical protein